MAREGTRIKRKSRSVPPKPETLPPCRVCDAKASGLHYGVYSCHGCKGFFRRSQTREFLYKCKVGQKTCALNRKAQRSCAYCRYQKCLTLGMSRDAIRTGRYTFSMRADNQSEINILKAGLGSDRSETDKGDGGVEKMSMSANADDYGESNSSHAAHEHKYEHPDIHDNSIQTKYADHIHQDSSPSVVVSTDRQSMGDAGIGLLGTTELCHYGYSEHTRLKTENTKESTDIVNTSYSDTLSNSSISSDDSSLLCNTNGRAFLFAPSDEERRRNNSFDSGAASDNSPITGTYSDHRIYSEEMPGSYHSLASSLENSPECLAYSDSSVHRTYNGRHAKMETHSNYHNPITNIDHHAYRESNYLTGGSSGLQPNIGDTSGSHCVDAKCLNYNLQDGRKVNNEHYHRPVVDVDNYSETQHWPVYRAADHRFHSELEIADGSTIRPFTPDNRRQPFEIVQHICQSNEDDAQLPSLDGSELSASNDMCLDSAMIAKLDSVNNQNVYYGMNLNRKQSDEHDMPISQIIHENNILTDFQFDTSSESKPPEDRYRTEELTQLEDTYSSSATCNRALREARKIEAECALDSVGTSGINNKATGDIQLGDGDCDSDSIPDLVLSSAVLLSFKIGELGESEMNSVSDIVTVAQTKYNIVGQLLQNEEELRNQQREYYEQQKLKDNLFGDLKALSRDEFNAFYKATGIDLDNRFQFADKVLHIYEREVVKYIRFCQCIPGFSELPVADQSAMLKGSVFESGFLESYRTYNYELGVTTFPEGSCFRLKDICYLDNHEYGVLKLEFAKQLRELDVGTTEIAFLKAIILLFTDRFPLESPAEAEMLQVKMIRCFRHYLRRTRCEEADRRFFTLWNRVIAVRNLAELNIKLRQHTIIDYPKVQQFPLSYQLVYGQ